MPRSLELAGRTTRLMRAVISTLEVRADRMWESLIGGFPQATDLAEHVMAACGVDYRTAYLVVGDAVRTAGSEGLRGIDLTGGMLDRAAQARIGRPLGLEEADLEAAPDPRAIVSTRTAPGVVRTLSAECVDWAGRLTKEARRRADAAVRPRPR